MARAAQELWAQLEQTPSNTEVFAELFGALTETNDHEGMCRAALRHAQEASPTEAVLTLLSVVFVHLFGGLQWAAQVLAHWVRGGPGWRRRWRPRSKTGG